MTGGPWRRWLDTLRRHADPDANGPLADQRLLARFVANGDPSAFELLVWRHGNLVHGACCRILDDKHAAEDAFQATFLALARKPRAVRNGAALAGWLHRVAVRIANKLLATRQRQVRAERSASKELSVPPVDAGRHEITAVVDQEIDRLSDRLRRAVVLCYLDGRTTEQAAQLLGCPRGTVISRLAAARERLRIRLAERGVALPVAGITATFLAAESPAGLIPAAVSAALGGASPVLIGLVQGVFHAMMMTKVKISTAAVLSIALVGTAVGWIVVPRSGPNLVRADAIERGPFDGKTVLVQTKSTHLALQEVSSIQFGGRQFMIGRPVELQDLVKKGIAFGSREMWVPVNEIEVIRVFDEGK